MTQISLRFSGDRSCLLILGEPLAGLGARLVRLTQSRRVFVVSSPRVWRAQGAALRWGLKEAGLRCRCHLIADGEEAKTSVAVLALCRAAAQEGFDRSSPWVVLGGGVLGDVAGFAASVFLRGVPVVQCPTTLLAMVDAAVGGKTGVDLPEGKNLLGTFHQPRLVWMDPDTLHTLPDREWRVGMAEVIKYGVLKDPQILTDAEAWSLSDLQSNPTRLKGLILRSVRVKARMVQRDEREIRGLRAGLNLGHTLGHALETLTHYKTYSHGEAVAVGLCAALRLSAHREWMTWEDVRRLESLLDQWGLPTKSKKSFAWPQVARALNHDKKTLAGRWRFVLPVAWGQVRLVSDVTPREAKRVAQEVGVSS